MTRAEYSEIDLETLLERLVARSDGIAFWGDDQSGIDAINEALQVFNAMTGRWKGEVAFPLQPNGPYVPLPAALTSPLRVTCNGIPLYGTSLVGLDAARRSWEGETVADGGDVPTRPTMWAPVGLYTLAYWPAVVETYSNSLRVTGVAQTPILLRMQDYIQCSPGEISSILGEAMHILTLGIGGETFSVTMPDHQTFIGAAARQNARLTALSWVRESAAFDKGRAARQTELPPTKELPGQEPAGPAALQGQS